MHFGAWFHTAVHFPMRSWLLPLSADCVTPAMPSDPPVKRSMSDPEDSMGSAPWRLKAVSLAITPAQLLSLLRAPEVWDAQSVPPSFSHSTSGSGGHNLTCFHQHLQAKWSGATQWILLWCPETVSTWTLHGNGGTGPSLGTFIFRTLSCWKLPYLL